MRERVAAALLVGFVAGVVALHAVDHHPLGSALSVFSVGPFAWVYQASFAAAALALATMASGRTGWARAWLAAASFGAALSATFPSTGVGVNVADRAHLGGSLLFVVATSAVLWVGRPSPVSRGLALSATLLLAVTAALKVLHSVHTGVFQRLLVAVVMVGLFCQLFAENSDGGGLAPSPPTP